MKRKTRMYEPWGYRDENNYESSEIIHENDLESFFSDVNYNKDDNKIHFQNKDGEEVASLDVNEFVKSDSIIDHTEYADGILKIFFTNGDVVTIDLTELLDENEFKDGLIVEDGIVKVLVDGDSDKYISVSENGVKVAGVEADIEAEKTRAEGEEERIENKLDNEITRAISAETELDTKIEAEITRSTDEDARLDNKIDAETTRAEAAETNLSRRTDTLNDELDAEESIREAKDLEEKNRATAAETALQTAISSEGQRAQDAETALDNKIDQEIADRIADVNAEESRATSAETALSNAIDAEETRAEAAEEALSDRIDAIESGSTQALNDEIARAKAAEAALEDAIEDEASARTSADAALLDAISGEVQNRIADVDAEEARAEAAEQALSDAIDGVEEKIDQEIADRKAESVANVEYDESGKTINFYNKNGETIATVDAKDFIKDGMIDSVTLETTGGTTYLVIVWNTASGKEETRIDIGDIFDADNYYTKAEIDTIVSGITGDIEEALEELEVALNAEIVRATSAETALDDAIEAEATARDNADVKSMAVDANASITLTLGNGSTIVATEAAEITLSAGEF